jgi:sulfotransferase
MRRQRIKCWRAASQAEAAGRASALYNGPIPVTRWNPTVQNDIHFISGLPRAGSTLLSALLRQNPRFHASMSGPMATLFTSLQREMGQGNEYSVFIDNAQRARILTAIFDAYYHDIHPRQVVFDTNRLWTTKLPALTALFPRMKMICSVRNVAWVLDSVESLIRRNCLEPSKIFNFEPGGNVYSRIEGLASATGMVGFALHALREAVYGEQADRLLLVRYETLTADPLGTLAKIYEFLGEPPYAHDPDHAEAVPGAVEFDARLGTPGLHRVGPAVHRNQRRSILPADLFSHHQGFSFWEIPEQMPSGIRLI